MSTALYRRYRPETFAEVIGQEHVTEPLMAALRADRVSHAYLFSGPRGCGKTTSARILARCLNCATGPTDTPCGTCPSCVDLARGGPGSLDVVEMDAASHGGVDDARELRERAAFAPARDRFKVFIIDEAHMVTTQGFNALLKLVEEPPEHVKFIFATTEPDKVIGTIRSRTHHYPFRLVPPERLQTYLQEICETEGVRVDAGVLPLVVRAGGGSVRDSLSVLDQLIAGAVDGGVDYRRAIALLGYTDTALLDDAMDALAAKDGASVFRVIDRVVETGLDPRRFVEDLLQRLRDVVLIAIAGEHAVSTLRGMPEDQVARIRSQAQHLGAAQASRAADLVNEALNEMGGATSPRLHLELLAARLLLPATDAAGLGARLERLEQHVATGAASAAPEPPARSAASASEPDAEVTSPLGAPSTTPTGGGEAERRFPAAGPSVASARAGAPVAPGDVSPSPSQSDAEHMPHGDAVAPGREEAPSKPREEPAAEEAQVLPTAAPPRAASAPAVGAGGRTTGGADAEMVRRRWPEVVATLARLRRSTWALVSQNAQVGTVSEGVLRLSFTTAGLASTFRSGPHAGPVQQALAETLGVQLRVEAVVDGDGDWRSGSGGAGWGGGSGGAGWGDGSGGAGWGDGGASGQPPGPQAPSPVEAARASWSSPPDAPSAGSPGAYGAAPDASAGVRAGAMAMVGAAGASGDGAAPGYIGNPGRPWTPGSGPSGGPDAPPGQPAGGAGAGYAAEPARTGFRTDGADEGLSPDGADERLTADGVDPRQRGAASGGGPGTGTPVNALSATSPSFSSQSAPSPEPPRVAPEDDEASMDDPDAEGSGLVGVPLVVKMLGATIIEDGPVGPQN